MRTIALDTQARLPEYALVFPYRRLKVWEKAHGLAVALLRDTDLDADARTRLLAAQLRRAALSVPANIVEGACSESQALFARYLGIARASAGEVEYHLLAGRDAELIPKERVEAHLRESVEIRRMLTALAARVRAQARR